MPTAGEKKAVLTAGEKEQCQQQERKEQCQQQARKSSANSRQEKSSANSRQEKSSANSRQKNLIRKTGCCKQAARILVQEGPHPRFGEGRNEDPRSCTTTIQLSRPTPDGYEEKNTDSVIQHIYKLGGTVQAIVPVLPEPELSTPSTKQSADQKRNDGLSTNQSEAIRGRCRTQQTSDSRASRMRQAAVLHATGQLQVTCSNHSSDDSCGDAECTCNALNEARHSRRRRVRTRRS